MDNSLNKHNHISSRNHLSTLKSCRLAECHSNNDRKVDLEEEHFRTVQHQRSIALLAQKLVGRINASGPENTFLNSTDTNNIFKFYGILSEQVQNIGIIHENMSLTSSEFLKKNYYLQTRTKQIDEVIEDTEIKAVHVKGILLNQNLLKQSIKHLKQRTYDINQKANCYMRDNTIIWKIDNVRECINDSESERRISLFSPSFYTSPSGYNISVRLFFNGDGTARGRYLSIFFVILRGKFDAILKWPFSYKVSFCLFDQRSIIDLNAKREPQHIIESFRPDIRSTSFQRPSTHMNIASGIPAFISLDKLHESPITNRYIINDILFIKVFIDFGELPKLIIPFIFNLNIGLPLHIQQKLINEEIKRIENLKST